MLDIGLKKAANLGQIEDWSGGYLPKEVSDKVLEEIESANIMRRFVDVIPVAGKTLTVPRVLWGDALNAYKVSYGSSDVTEGRNEVGFTTKTLVLEPQLLVAFAYLLEHDLATAGLDLSKYIRRAMTRTIAKAEENLILTGVEAGGEGSYLTMFDGLYTKAADAGKCAVTPITYTASDDLVDKISDAIKALGAYGDDRGSLVLIAANTFANRLRQSDKVAKLGYYAPGEGKGVVRTGILPPVHGVKSVESSVLETKESGEVALLLRTDGAVLGQRGRIIFRKEHVAKAFQYLLIMAEEIDLVWKYLNAADKALGMVLIHKSGT